MCVCVCVCDHTLILFYICCPECLPILWWVQCPRTSLKGLRCGFSSYSRSTPTASTLFFFFNCSRSADAVGLKSIYSPSASSPTPQRVDLQCEVLTSCFLVSKAHSSKCYPIKWHFWSEAETLNSPCSCVTMDWVQIKCITPSSKKAEKRGARDEFGLW